MSCRYIIVLLFAFYSSFCDSMTIYLFSLQAVSLLLPEIPKVELRVRAPRVIILTFCVSGCHCKFRFNLQFHWRYFSSILSIKSQGRNVGNGFGSVPQLSEHAWTLVHVHFENDNFNIFDLPLPQPRPQCPRSIDQRKISIVIIRRQTRLAVEKRFHFLVPGTIFISLSSGERCPKHCGRVRLWRKIPPYFQKTRGLKACLLQTAVSRSGFTQSQKTAHTRTVIQSRTRVF